MSYQENEYLNVLKDIMENGTRRNNRTGTDTISKFGVRMEFDISNKIPAFTTKKVFWKKVIGELLWFVSGKTDIQSLHKDNIHFWDDNGSRDFLDKRGLSHYNEGDLGPVYGFQWRHWGEEYNGSNKEYKGIDQLNEIINLIKNDPYSRRMILSAWNVSQLEEMALPPCHLLCQFYVRFDKNNNKFLDCQLYQRSGDLFLGVPFNILSYSTLIYMICNIIGDISPGKFIHTIGDAHIYVNHIDQVKEQLSRDIREWPELKINKIGKNIDDFSLDDFELIDYNPHPYIRAKMAI